MKPQTKKETNFPLWILLNCLLGLALSTYSLVVELHMAEDPNYVAYCDLSESVSCSKAFLSRFGKGFGIVEILFGEGSILNQPNPVVGIIFYTVAAILGFFEARWAAKLNLYLGIISVLGSVYLAYILYFILYNACVVCISTYVVNGIHVILVRKQLEKMKKIEQPRRELLEKIKKIE